MVIPERVGIEERPKEADGRRFGDFEMDTIVGKGKKGVIVTLVERSTNMLFMRKLPQGKKAVALARAVVNMLEPFKGKIKTITTDNGTEFTCHRIIARALETDIYFADTHAPWQKPAIENMNGLIRQYVEKETDITQISKQRIRKIERKINNRPRKKLNFKTPEQCFFELIP